MTPSSTGLGRDVRRGRPKDAAATKEALLAAAQHLFGQRGYEATTTREIGERAGVDPALIARYFGSKALLYIAAVVAEARGDEPTPDLESVADVARALVRRTDRHGVGPVTQALIRSDTAQEIRSAAQAHLTRRLVQPMVEDLSRRGVDQPRLRAEVVVAALMGITLGRANGWFDELSAVGEGPLVELVAALLDQGGHGVGRTPGLP